MSNSPTEKLVKCWICEKQYSGVNCPECGPPEPWGPTADEISGKQMAAQEVAFFFTNHPDVD